MFLVLVGGLSFPEWDAGVEPRTMCMLHNHRVPLSYIPSPGGDVFLFWGFFETEF
jgi:hypothetical protein